MFIEIKKLDQIHHFRMLESRCLKLAVIEHFHVTSKRKSNFKHSIKIQKYIVKLYS